MDLRSLVRAKRTTEILLQGESHGIIYEGYDKAFIQCIFEEGSIQGRNERYEFRCDASLQCCGRSCCIPEDATIPLWLLVLFIILASLIALALLATLAYLLAQKLKNRPKKQANAYQTLTDNGLDKSHLMEEEKYSSPYGDRDRDRWRDEMALLEEQRRAREDLERERERERERLERERMAQERERLRRELEDLDRLKAEQMRGRRGSSDSDRSSVVHTRRETVEENFVSEVRYEREASDDEDRHDHRRRYL